MCRDPYQERTHDQGESSCSAKTEFAVPVSQSALNAFGQKLDYGQLDERVKEPQHDQRQRKRQNENAGKGVAESSVWTEPNEIFVVGRERANQQRRGYKAKPSERKNSCTMRWCERHSRIMNCHR